MRIWKVCGCRYIDYEKDGKPVRAKEYHFASAFVLTLVFGLFDYFIHRL